jgi:cytochrome c oxidase assembly protein subunit 11
MTTTPLPSQRNNRRVAWLLSLIALGMFGFGFALVPLYKVLCDVTGVQRVTLLSEEDRMTEVQQSTDESRTLVVKFDASVQPDLPWDFEPFQGKIEVHPGATYEVKFLAHNRSSSKVYGQAIPNVVPWQATPYFNKIECFCFSRQSLAGGETVEMPLRFVVSRDLPVGINSLTLSYNFMKLAAVAEEDDSATIPATLSTTIAATTPATGTITTPATGPATPPKRRQQRKIDVSQGF